MRSRTLVAMLAAVFTMAALVLPGIVSSAQAATNPNISITNLVLTKTDANGVPQTGNLRVSDIATLTFDWAVAPGSENTLTAGDSFAITFPATLTGRVQTTTELKMPIDGVEEVVGSCTVTGTALTCTLNETLPTKATEGKTGFGGNATLQLSARAATTDETVTFTTTGTPGSHVVDLPGTGGITAPSVAGYAPTPFGKGMAGISELSKNTVYPLRFNTDDVTSIYANHGVTINFDGTTVQTLTVIDKLGPDQQFSDPASWLLRHKNSVAAPAVSNDILAKGDGVPTTTPRGTFTVKVTPGPVTAAGQEARIEITGPFTASTNYELTYTGLPVSSTNLRPGVVYSNTAELVYDVAQDNDEDVLKSNTVSRSFVSSFNSNVMLQPGYGTFRVQKYIQGPGSTQVPADQTYTVKLDYVLPADADTYRPDDAKYPNGWTPPASGTLNPDKRTGTAEFSITQGRSTTFVGPNAEITFPAGTKVTLTEVVATAPAPTGYRWTTPVFKVGNQDTNTLTIGNATTSVVELTNSLEQAFGSFTVSKSYGANSSPDIGTDRTFSFSYLCDDPAATQGEITGVSADGTPVASNVTLPAGTKCTITENPAEITNYDLTAPAPVEVTVTDGANGATPVNAAFENTYTRHTGSFTVAKVITGDYTAAANDSFEVAYACDNQVNGTLMIPGDGSPVQGPTLPSGTSCTVTEDAASAERTGYSLVRTVTPNTVTITKDGNDAVQVTNDYHRLDGDLTITKSIAGDGAHLAPAEVVFDYACTDLAGVASNGTITLTAADGWRKTLTDIAQGECTITERDASIGPNASLTTSIMVGGVETQGNQARVEIIDGQTASVDVTNTYTLNSGTFSITKNVVANGAEVPGEYPFSYSCDGVTKTLLVPGDGTAIQSDPIKVGTSCTITEDTAAVQVPGYTLVSEIDKATVTIEAANTVVPVQATNTYTQDMATFSITKNVVANGASVPADFSFSYSCGTDLAKTLTVPGDGTPVVSDAYPAGTECTVSEDSSAAQVDGYTLTTVLSVDGRQLPSGTFTLGARDSITEVSVTNSYQKVPAPEDPEPTDPGAEPTPDDQPRVAVRPQALPETGSGLVSLGALGILVLIASVTVNRLRKN